MVPSANTATSRRRGARIAVFGYASLVSTASAAQTLRRAVDAGPLARLHGWRRRWSTVRDNLAVEKTFARADSGELPPFVLSLNVEPVPVSTEPPIDAGAATGETGARDAGEPPNGVLIEVSELELERLDLRELRFRRVDVTEAIEPSHRETASHPAKPPGPLAFDRVYAYTARPENLAAEPPDGAVIIAAYAHTVERCFAQLGPGELDHYLRTTGPPPVEPIEAILVRDLIPPGNPRDW